MKKIMRGNRQLSVADDTLDRYLEQGYAEIDDKTGKVTRKGKEDSDKALKAQLVEANTEVESLKAQLLEAKNQLAAAKGKESGEKE